MEQKSYAMSRKGIEEMGYDIKRNGIEEIAMNRKGWA